MTIPTDLIDKILERTREHKLSWQQLSTAGFTAQILPNAVIIDQTIDRRGSISHVLRIANENGTVLDTASDEGEWEERLKEIYQLARRQALHVDETLLSIKDALEKL
jgi:hypothetical protein